MRSLIVSLPFFLMIFFSMNSYSMNDGRSKFELNLKKLAEEKGTGYKAANLTIIEPVIEEFNSQGYDYKIAIPAFMALPSPSIQNFVANRALIDFDIVEGWKSIIKRHFSTKIIQKEILKAGNYPDSFLKDCELFRNKLHEAFNAFIINSEEKISLDKLFELRGIDQLLVQIESSNERLMVRSTGKEDTAELANAGGNETIANVAPTSKEVLLAVRDVIISYFGEKSLKQRLMAKDLTVFTGMAFTPVLLQRMIGERDGVVPRCGVMFTEEAEGGISRYHDHADKFAPIQTTGITIIQAAYGHNEAVVNSLIAVDSYYVDRSKNIYPVIRYKTHRMVPVKDSISSAKRLSLVKNEASLIKNSALNRSAVLSLKALADTLENFYLRPMDVEYVVNEQEKTIYIVQSRPIVHRKDMAEASYLLDPKALPTKKLFWGQAIGVAGGALRIALNKNEIIIAPTINEALNIYQNDKKSVPNKSQIQAIIIGKVAPRTSHEATQFRSEGKPVIFIPEWQQLRELTTNEIALIISPQQDLVAVWKDSNIENLDVLFQKQLATVGWSSYPVDKVISVSKEFLAYDLSISEAINKFLGQTTATKLQAQLSQKLEIIKNGSPTQATKALGLLLQYIDGLLQKTEHGLQLDKETGSLIDLYKSYIVSCAYHLEKNLYYQPTDKLNYSKRLFAISFLENLILQQPNYDEIVAGDSFVKWIKTLREERTIVKELASNDIKLDRRAVQYMRLSTLAFTKELENQFKDFVTKFSRLYNFDSKERISFENIITTLRSLDALSMWLHTSFAKAYKSSDGNPTEVFGQLLSEFNDASHFIAELNQQKEKIVAFNENAAFLSQKDFTIRWTEFKESLLSYFLSTDFLDGFKTNNDLGRTVAMSVMTKLVDKFDLSIKAVTGNGEYSRQGKSSNFQTMLLSYADLFEQWTTLVKDVKKYTGCFSPSYYLKNNLSCGIKDILNKPATEEMLMPTPLFNAFAFTIGAQASFAQITPKTSTFEDAFMVTHQCLLATLSMLALESGAEQLIYPALIKEAAVSLKKLENNINYKFELIGFNLADNTIKMFYNMPLSYHSAQFELSYIRGADEVSIRTRFYGHGGRWKEIADFIQLIGVANLLSVKDIQLVADSGVTLLFSVKTKEEIALLVDCLRGCIQRTLSHDIKYDRYLAKAVIDSFDILKSFLATKGLTSFLEKTGTRDWTLDELNTILGEEYTPSRLNQGTGDYSKTISELFKIALQRDFAKSYPIAKEILIASLEQKQAHEGLLSLAKIILNNTNDADNEVMDLCSNFVYQQVIKTYPDYAGLELVANLYEMLLQHQNTLTNQVIQGAIPSVDALLTLNSPQSLQIACKILLPFVNYGHKPAMSKAYSVLTSIKNNPNIAKLDKNIIGVAAALWLQGWKGGIGVLSTSKNYAISYGACEALAMVIELGASSNYDQIFTMATKIYEHATDNNLNKVIPGVTNVIKLLAKKGYQKAIDSELIK